MRSTSLAMPKYDRTGAGKREAIGANGFTLLELMLSLTILGLVLLIVFGALRIGTRAWEKGEKDVNIQQRQRAVLSLMEKQLASACLYEIKVGDDPFYFRGSETDMEFVSRIPMIPGGRSQIVYVRYHIKAEDVGRKMQLLLYEKEAGYLKAEDLEFQEDEDFFLLISGVENCNFNYMKPSDSEGETDWQVNWNPSEDKGMPVAVRISLQQTADVAPISLVVPIRCQ